MLLMAVTVVMGGCDLGEETHELEIDYEGLGDTSPEQGVHEYEEGTEVELEAMAYDEDWEFVNWKGDVEEEYEPETTIALEEDEKVVAVFAERDDASYELSINYEGRGEVVPAMGTHEYEAEELVEIEAIPAEGWKFDYWRGDVIGADEPVTQVYMDADKDVTAVFMEEE